MSLKHIISAVLLFGALCTGGGCAMCKSPYDYYYGAYGGTWQRCEMCRGRVGSASYPAGDRVFDSAETEIIQPGY